MTYYIRAFIKGDQVAGVNSCADPIINDAIISDFEASVTCEVEGDYEFAADILPLLGWTGGILTGVNTLSQVVHVYPRP